MQRWLHTWLEQQCQMIAGAEAALLVLGAARYAPSSQVVVWPAALQDTVPAPLDAVVQEALDRRVPIVQPASAPEPVRATGHFALPIETDAGFQGAFAVRIAGVMPSETKAVTALLGYCVRGLCRCLELERRRQMAEEALDLAAVALEQGSLDERAHAVAVELARSLECNRVALGFLRGQDLRVRGLSTELSFSQASDAVGDLKAVMHECLDEDAPVQVERHSTNDDHGTVREHRAVLHLGGSDALSSIPLVSHGRPIGAATLEWRGSTALDRRRKRAEHLLAVCGPIFAQRLQLALIWHSNLWGKARIESGPVGV